LLGVYQLPAVYHVFSAEFIMRQQLEALGVLMLTKRMQVQYMADRLAGLPVEARALDFQQPWLACWQALEKAENGHEQVALYEAVSGLAGRDEILQAILGTRPGYRPSIPSLADIADDLPPIEWVWQDWIPRGLLTVLGAAQGSGKSFVATDLAWRIIHNKSFPNGAAIKRPGANVIYVDGEMVPQILNERAQEYHLDKTKLFMLLPEPGEMLDLGIEHHQERLSEMAAILNPELIIIDSLSSIHIGGQNNVEDIRSLIVFMTRLAGWANCGLVLIHHMRKPPGGGPRMMNADLGMEDLSGSGFITQQARVVLGLRVVQTGQEFDANGPREFKMLKNSIGPYPAALGFSFKPLHPTSTASFSKGVILDWHKEAPKTYREPTQRDECGGWLEDYLRASPEGAFPKEVIAAGREMGYSRALVYRARKERTAHIDNTEGRQAPGNRWKWSEKALEVSNVESE
jgi:AAA domain